jgi:hypothetical protein
MKRKDRNYYFLLETVNALSCFCKACDDPWILDNVRIKFDMSCKFIYFTLQVASQIYNVLSVVHVQQ